ncbi:MAG TPA: pantoate--beta-alanine ligase [Bacteroidales bacterium]|nr:pantoate--beta-alanine ligase [Bacteroidales bacterium]
MKITALKADLKLQKSKFPKKPSGFVPTMGALHEGHLSLVHEAVLKCPIVIVSIFVNPTQFNDKNDLRNYPRNIEKDLKLLSPMMRENDIVFTPEVSEIYPEEDKRQFHFGNLDNVMEALHRPGHFNGVAQVVSRLFEITEPDVAFFGIKDFQQVAVIKDLVRQTNSKVKIISCPIVREKDGLAMSSRNMLLDPAIRKNAPVIFKTLTSASEMFTDHDVSDIKGFVFDRINSIRGFDVEYFEIADDTELYTINSKKEMIPDRKYYGCIAVKAGSVRLIDNVQMPGQD